MLARREQHADERMLAMDAMIQEREKRARKRLQSLADMVKFRSMETDDNLEELMRAIRDGRDAQKAGEESATAPTIGGQQTPATSADPSPLRPNLEARHSQMRDVTTSRTGTQLRPPIMNGPQATANIRAEG